jgi:hypothetical protein
MIGDITQIIRDLYVVYVIFNGSKIVYIGKSHDAPMRVFEHIGQKDDIGQLMNEYKTNITIWFLNYHEVNTIYPFVTGFSTDRIDYAEEILISYYMPDYNVSMNSQ